MQIFEAKIAYKLISLGDPTRIDSPAKVLAYMAGAHDEDPTVEWLHVIPLDRKNHPLGRAVVTRGTATSSLLHPREVFKPVILAGGTGFMIAHNHPSGDPSPSSADIQITRVIREAARIMQIDFFDHIIIGQPAADPAGRGYFSFSEAGLV
jgi:DNA repair protein RadC